MVVGVFSVPGGQQYTVECRPGRSLLQGEQPPELAWTEGLRVLRAALNRAEVRAASVPALPRTGAAVLAGRSRKLHCDDAISFINAGTPMQISSRKVQQSLPDCINSSSGAAADSELTAAASA